MALKSRKVKPPTSPEPSVWIDDIINDYGLSDGKKYDVGGREESVLNGLSRQALVIDYSVKSTGTNTSKPYLDIPDRRLLNNIIAELYMISILDAVAVSGDPYVANVWSVLHRTATPINRKGKSQPWQDFLKGLLQDKIKYKHRIFNRKKQKYTNDISLDQLLHLDNLFDLLLSNSDFKGVDFVEGF
ncbi:hypothetical protein G6M12_19465 [Agrobacterium tumefaciens]|nr:hypothetical protein [Agrobacterium tumefaciens]